MEKIKKINNKAIINLASVYRINPINILDNMSIIKYLTSILIIDQEKLLNGFEIIKDQEYYEQI